MELDAEDMKRELLRKSAKHREKIEGEMKLISQNTEKMITNAIVIGGSLALTYYVVTKLSGSSKKKSKKRHRKVKIVQASETPEVVHVEAQQAESTPGVIGQIGAALVSQASVFILNLAKEKLMEYLQTVGEKKSAG